MKPSVFQIVSPAPEPPPPEPPFVEDPALRKRLERIFTGQEPPPVMTAPPEVLEMLDKILEGYPHVVPSERQRLLDNLCLRYHYGGQEVLTWPSPQGLAVLAVGSEEVASVQNHLSAERSLEVLGQFPRPW